MLVKPAVRQALDDFVVVKLYTDTSDAAHNARVRGLRDRYGAAAIPYYVFLGPDGTVHDTLAGLTDIPTFLGKLTITKAAVARAARAEGPGNPGPAGN